MGRRAAVAVAAAVRPALAVAAVSPVLAVAAVGWPAVVGVVGLHFFSHAGAHDERSWATDSKR